MSRAICFLHSLDDVRYAVRALGLPLELIPNSSLHGNEKVRLTQAGDLENAYRQLCSISTSDEFTALRP